MRGSQRRPWITLLVASVVIGGSLGTFAVSRASTSAGCGSVDTPIIESKQFTPAEQRLTSPLDPSINPLGEGSMTVPTEASVASIDGLPLSWSSVVDGGAVYQYFADTGIDANLTVSEFFAAGGVQLDRDPADNNESFAEYALASLRDRAVKIDVGSFTGALVWADPDAKGIRTHNLYWSDGKYNYTLSAVTSPEHLVTLGRDLVCA